MNDSQRIALLVGLSLLALCALLPPRKYTGSTGGLLPLGEDDNRHPFCWLTEGSADAWHIINLDSHYSEAFRRIPTTITGLLAGWFSGELTGDWYPEDIDPTQERVFTAGRLP